MIFEQILAKRGLSGEKLEKFLHPKYEDGHDPMKLPDVKKAVARMEKAQENGERVVIFGDYDADGVTSVALLFSALKSFGFGDLQYLLPERFAGGYGLTMSRVEELKKMGAQLVITVDSGSRDLAEVEELNKAGIDVVITDHHEPGAGLPAAVAVVNPKRADSKYPFRELSGVGVAFKLVQALQASGLRGLRAGQEKWFLDLVAIGTVCDVVSLTDENRINVFYGMKVLAKTRRCGLQELMRAARMKEVSTGAVGFQIGPRLNVAGRLDSPVAALELLLEENKAAAYAKAKALDELNGKRKTMQNLAAQEALDSATEAEQKMPVLFFRGEDWHEGVIGIIAGQLLERYKKPVFVFTESEGKLKGSARSFGEFSLAEAVDHCGDLVLRGGGHAAAAGVTLDKKNYRAFRDACCDFYNGLGLKNQHRFFEVAEDASTSNVKELNAQLYKEIKQLEPFGEGNPEPVLKLENVLVLEARLMGQLRNHLRLNVRGADGGIINLLAFDAPEEWRELEKGSKVDVWFNLCRSEYRGMASIEGRILQIKPCIL